MLPKGFVGAGGDDRGGILVREAAHQAQPEAHGMTLACSDRLQRAIPARGIDIDRAHRDPVKARIAHELRRRIKPHRLRIQDRGKKHVRMPAFHPARRIGEQRERGRVAFRKPVRAEAFELRESLLGECLAA